MHTYCLFCQSLRCKRIAELLECQGIERAISPQIMQNHRKQGRVEKQAYDLLPGYVFVYSSTPLTSFTTILSTDGVIRLLGNAETQYQLSDSDHRFAMSILEMNGSIDDVQIIKEGDVVRLNHPLFSDLDAVVLRIDYRKKRAQISYQFDKQEWKTWVACDVVFTNRKV